VGLERHWFKGSRRSASLWVSSDLGRG
jgi:hypothetical protein